MEIVTVLAGAAGAGAAPAAAGATVAAGSSALGAASFIGSAFSALATIGSGIAAANELKGQAAYEGFKANDERIKGTFAAADIRKQMGLTMQRNKVAFAAGGVDGGSITAQTVQQQVAKDAEQELGMNDANTWRAMLAHQAEKRRLRQRASTTLFTSIFNAGLGLAQAGLQGAQRG